MTQLGNDSFIRANVSSGWGTATDGQTWTHLRGTGPTNVTSNEGIIANTPGTWDYMLLGSSTSADMEVLCRIKRTGSNDMAGVIFRSDSGANTNYKFVYDGSAGTAKLYLYRESGGAGAVTVTSATATNTFNVFFWYRARIVGSTILCKYWQSGTAEPAAWNIQTTDINISGAGQFGVVGNSNNNGLSYDSFYAVDYAYLDILTQTDVSKINTVKTGVDTTLQMSDLQSFAFALQLSDPSTLIDATNFVLAESISDLLSSIDSITSASIPVGIIVVEQNTTTESYLFTLLQTESEQSTLAETFSAAFTASFTEILTQSEINLLTLFWPTVEAPLLVQEALVMGLQQNEVNIFTLLETISWSFPVGFSEILSEQESLFITQVNELPPAIATIFAQDSFSGRTVASSWGTSSDGEVWSNAAGSTPTLSVGSGEGHMQVGGFGSTYMILGTGTQADQLAITRASMGGTNSNIGILLRFSNVGSVSTYRVIVSATFMLFDKVVNGTQSFIGSSTPVSMTETGFIWIKFQVVGTQLLAKAWNDGSMEPTNWMLNQIDSDLSSGQYGLYANPDPTATLSFDHFVVEAATVNFIDLTTSDALMATIIDGPVDSASTTDSLALALSEAIFDVVGTSDSVLRVCIPVIPPDSAASSDQIMTALAATDVDIALQSVDMLVPTPIALFVDMLSASDAIADVFIANIQDPGSLLELIGVSLFTAFQETLSVAEMSQNTPTIVNVDNVFLGEQWSFSLTTGLSEQIVLTEAFLFTMRLVWNESLVETEQVSWVFVEAIGDQSLVSDALYLVWVNAFSDNLALADQGAWALFWAQVEQLQSAERTSWALAESIQDTALTSTDQSLVGITASWSDVQASSDALSVAATLMSREVLFQSEALLAQLTAIAQDTLLEQELVLWNPVQTETDTLVILDTSNNALLTIPIDTLLLQERSQYNVAFVPIETLSSTENTAWSLGLSWFENFLVQDATKTQETYQPAADVLLLTEIDSLLNFARFLFMNGTDVLTLAEQPLFNLIVLETDLTTVTEALQGVEYHYGLVVGIVRGGTVYAVKRSGTVNANVRSGNVAGVLD